MNQFFSFHSRAAEREQKLIEEETQKRVEEMVAKRVEGELAKHKDEIDSEVMRRVEEAKKVMEKQMLEEFERRKVEQMEALRKKEVKCKLQSCMLVETIEQLWHCIFGLGCIWLQFTICKKILKVKDCKLCRNV